jgi:hypothetical protein
LCRFARVAENYDPDAASFFSPCGDDGSRDSIARGDFPGRLFVAPHAII